MKTARPVSRGHTQGNVPGDKIEGSKEMEDPNFGPEMTAYRALELAIRSGFTSGNPAPTDEIVERARKYRDFMTEASR